MLTSAVAVPVSAPVDNSPITPLVVEYGLYMTIVGAARIVVRNWAPGTTVELGAVTIIAPTRLLIVPLTQLQLNAVRPELKRGGNRPFLELDCRELNIVIQGRGPVINTGISRVS